MTKVVSVRFRSGCKTYYFNPGGLNISAGQDVIVDTAQGLEYAQCVEGNHEVADDAVVQPLRMVMRIATENDYHTAAYNQSREKEAFDICQKKILKHELDMKLVRVECSFDGSKILFFFTADGRVDFRELVKDLAGVFRSRIELRQIGVRDEAKMLGGLGICGRPFCCSQFLDDFIPVSIKMAKTQNLSLNPTKISGTCGRLMCCLKYEQDAYEDAVKRLPKNDSFVVTPDGPGNVSDVNVLKETVNVKLDGHPETPHCYHNCEVCVLRNGKGSRDGIEVPTRWPERYVEKPVADEYIAPALLTGEDSEAASDSEAAEQSSTSRSSRRRNRGGHHRGADRPSAAPASESTQTPASEQTGSSHRSRHRRGRSGGQKPAQQNSVPTAAADKPQSTGEKPAHKSRHRGGRHHGKPRPQGQGET